MNLFFFRVNESSGPKWIAAIGTRNGDISGVAMGPVEAAMPVPANNRAAEDLADRLASFIGNGATVWPVDARRAAHIATTTGDYA